MRAVRYYEYDKIKPDAECTDEFWVSCVLCGRFTGVRGMYICAPCMEGYFNGRIRKSTQPYYGIAP